MEGIAGQREEAAEESDSRVWNQIHKQTIHILRRLGVDAAGEIRCVLTVRESRKKQTGLGGKEWEILFHALPSPARHHFGQLHLEPDLAAKVDKFRGF